MKNMCDKHWPHTVEDTWGTETCPGHRTPSLSGMADKLPALVMVNFSSLFFADHL